jgi:L-malate glycosyltransferase
MEANVSLFSVLHFSTGKSIRGGERQVMMLHRELLKRRIQSILVCKKGGGVAAHGLETSVPIAWHGEWDLRGLFTLVRVCKKYKPSLIHCHDAHALSHGSIAGKLCGIPVIATRRVVFPMGKSLFSRWKYSLCAAIIAISEAVAIQCRIAAPKNRIFVVGDGTDASEVTLGKAEARTRLGIDENEFVIGTVAHFSAEKDFNLVLHCAQRLALEKRGVLLVCIGPYNQAERRRRVIPETLMLTGPLDNAVQYYGAFDAYISTSSREGLGSALLDAVVRDIPAVAVDAEGTRDLFPETWPLAARGDYDGFICALFRMIDNFETAKHLAAACGIRARKIYSVDTITERTLDVYRATHG